MKKSFVLVVVIGLFLALATLTSAVLLRLSGGGVLVNKRAKRLKAIYACQSAYVRLTEDLRRNPYGHPAAPVPLEVPDYPTDIAVSYDLYPNEFGISSSNDCDTIGWFFCDPYLEQPWEITLTADY